jgi:hypothetical protein
MPVESDSTACAGGNDSCRYNKKASPCLDEARLARHSQGVRASGEESLIEPVLIGTWGEAATDQSDIVQGAIADVRRVAAEIQAIGKQTEEELAGGVGRGAHGSLPKSRKPSTVTLRRH